MLPSDADANWWIPQPIISQNSEPAVLSSINSMIVSESGKLGWLFSEAWARLSARQRNQKCPSKKSGTNWLPKQPAFSFLGRHPWPKKSYKQDLKKNEDVSAQNVKEIREKLLADHKASIPFLSQPIERKWNLDTTIHVVRAVCRVWRSVGASKPEYKSDSCKGPEVWTCSDLKMGKCKNAQNTWRLVFQG